MPAACLCAQLRTRDSIQSKRLRVWEYYAAHLREEGDCPVTEDLSRRLLRLLFYNDLEESDQARIVETICEFDDFAGAALNPKGGGSC